MSLQSRLTIVQDTLKTQVSAGLFDILTYKPRPSSPLRPKCGDAFPSFKLTNHNGGTVSTADRLKRESLVVVFTCGGWCPYCNLVLLAYQHKLSQIKYAGGGVLAVSPDTALFARDTVNKHELTYDIAVDTNNRVAETLGLVYEAPPSLYSGLSLHGIDIHIRTQNPRMELPLPGVFVVERDGSIGSVFISTNHTQCLEPGDIIDTLLIDDILNAATLTTGSF